MSVYERLVSKIADIEAAKASRKAIRYLQSLREESLLSGSDSGLKNAWDEICVQAQLGYSLYWDAYVLTAKQGILGAIFGLPEEKKLAIWLQTDDSTKVESVGGQLSAPHPIDEEIADYIFDEYLMNIAASYTNARIERFIENSISFD